jgi:hypothetical protein
MLKAISVLQRLELEGIGLISKLTQATPISGSKRSP